MKELLIIAISSALVSNVVLSQFLGICSFVGVSKKVETAAGMGGAEVSEKHAGFIINKDHATFEDVVTLIGVVQDTVFREFGVELEPEVKIIS